MRYAAERKDFIRHYVAAEQESEQQELEQQELEQQELEQAIGKINGKYSRFNWTPIHFFFRSFSLGAWCENIICAVGQPIHCFATTNDGRSVRGKRLSHFCITNGRLRLCRFYSVELCVPRWIG